MWQERLYAQSTSGYTEPLKTVEKVDKKLISHLERFVKQKKYGKNTVVKPERLDGMGVSGFGFRVSGGGFRVAGFGGAGGSGVSPEKFVARGGNIFSGALMPQYVDSPALRHDCRVISGKHTAEEETEVPWFLMQSPRENRPAILILAIIPIAGLRVG